MNPSDLRADMNGRVIPGLEGKCLQSANNHLHLSHSSRFSCDMICSIITKLITVQELWSFRDCNLIQHFQVCLINSMTKDKVS